MLFNEGYLAEGTDSKEKTENPPQRNKKEIKWDSPEFVKLQTGFQNNIYRAIIDEEIEKLKKPKNEGGEGLTAEDIEKMTLEERQLKAWNGIEDFGNNHAAAYKYLLKINREIFDSVAELEENNPGAPPKKSKTDSLEEYNTKKENYDTAKAEYDKSEVKRKELATRILNELRTDKMRLLNKVMEGLKVNKPFSKGGITFEEFMNYIKESFEEKYMNNRDHLKMVIDKSEETQEIFKEELQKIINNRSEKEAAEMPN